MSLPPADASITRWLAASGRIALYMPRVQGPFRYGEDNMWVLTELLGRTPSEVERFAEEGVI